MGMFWGKMGSQRGKDGQKWHFWAWENSAQGIKLIPIFVRKMRISSIIV
jgi:hypothetical protein